MKWMYLLIAFTILSCNNNDQEAGSDTDTTITTDAPDTTSAINNNTDPVKITPKPDTNTIKPEPTEKKVYANQRFKDVTVEKVGDNKYRIRGKGQIFEASFSWVIEDGHEELKQGHNMTDAGAPEWGNFDFTVEAVKKRPNSTLHIILYEISAKDGSRQHQLPIPLI